MTNLLILIPVALLLGALGLAAFIWALRSGQFEDLDGAAARILNDDEPEQPQGADTDPAAREDRVER
jgi:cbb3-type cytochrome oxidase maturation protein